MGRLTADPELKTTSSGVSVTSFTVAVDRQFKKDETDFINVTAWRQTADFVTKFFRKGSMIAVQGSIQTRSFEDKNGNKRTVTEIIADKAAFCGDKGNDTAEAEKPDLSVNFADAETDDGLPF
jgi:single-strand DNA-binding protein